MQRHQRAQRSLNTPQQHQAYRAQEEILIDEAAQAFSQQPVTHLPNALHDSRYAPKQRQNAAIHLSSTIGNQALQRLLVKPTVQRSLWDDITETAGEAANWLMGDTETITTDSGTQPAPNDTDTPMSDPAFTDEMLDNSSEPDFDAVLEDTPPPPSDIEGQMHDADISAEGLASSDEPAFENALDGDDAGASWFDFIFASIDQTDKTPPRPPEQMPDDRSDEVCGALEHQIRSLDEEIRYLYQLSESMFADLAAMKAEIEALERTNPISPRLTELKYRYEELLRRYNEIVDLCGELIMRRNELKAELERCKEAYKQQTPNEEWI